MEAIKEITRIKPLEQPEWTQILLDMYNRKPEMQIDEES